MLPHAFRFTGGTLQAFNLSDLSNQLTRSMTKTRGADAPTPKALAQGNDLEGTTMPTPPVVVTHLRLLNRLVDLTNPHLSEPCNSTHP